MPSPETLRSFTSEGFLTGLMFGFVALALGLLGAYVWRRRWVPPAPVVGLLLTGASIAALQKGRHLPSDLFVGVALLALAGAAFPWTRRIPLLAAAVAIPGAWWVTQVVDLPGAGWVQWLLFAWIVVGAPLTTSFDHHFAGRGFGPVLLLISIAGMFTVLPDTEEILVAFGVALPLALLAWPKVIASLGAVGVYPMLGVLAWVIAIGGRGRGSAVVGATACLAFLVVEPLVRWSRNQTLLDWVPNRWWRMPVVGVLQLVFVLLAARVAGLSDTPWNATLVVLLLLLGAATTLSLGGLRALVIDRL